MISPRGKKYRLAAAVANVMLVGVPAAQGATATWVPGGSGTWNDANNWSPNVIPNGVGDAAIFGPGTGARSITVDSGAPGFTVGSVSFDIGTTTFVNTLAAGTTGSNLILTNGGAGATITQNGTGTGSTTLSAPMTLNDNLTIAVNETSASASTGSVNWLSAVTGGTGGFTKTGPGMLTMNTSNKSYTGPTVFDTNSGRTRLANAGRPNATSSVTIKSGAQIELISSAASYLFGADPSVPLNLNGFGAAFWGAIRPTRDITDIIQNNVVLQSDTGVHMQGTGPDGATNPDKAYLSFAGAISGPGHLELTAPGGLSDNQIGRYVLGSDNTYTGGTTINGGTLFVATGAGLGTGPLQVNANVSQFINTVVNLNYGGAATTTTSGPLSGFITGGGGTATIKLNGTAYTVNQTADGSYVGAIVDGSASGSFGLAATSNKTLTLSGNLAYTGNTTVAGGHLALATNLTSSSAVNVSGGTLELTPGGGSQRVIRTPSVAVTGTGRLDVQDNKLITQTPVGTVSGGVYSDVTGMIQSGRGTGSWNGTHGIVTSQTNATNSILNSIGVATAQQVKNLANPTDTVVFAGQTVTGSDTLVMYTYGGDANLDGKIDISDYGRIDFNIPLGVAGWYNGDFNYDGKIDISDYGIIDFNIGIQGAQIPTGSGVSPAAIAGVTAVPEPISLGAIGFAGAIALTARRRRARRGA